MQIDVLSQNTLKLTLSRLDMFDLDIKYESLSGKNPDTKRLLSQVLRTVKLDKNAGVDFSGDRLFVEAFPRPDGGCMLYISCLSDDRAKPSEKKAIRLTAKGANSANFTRAASSASGIPSARLPADSLGEQGPDLCERGIICRFDGLNELRGACNSLHWQTDRGRLDISSSLYGNGNDYCLFISGDWLCSPASEKLTASVLREYGEIIGDGDDLIATAEYYNLLVPKNAVEKMYSVL